jgi:hypothetical protein
MSVFIDIPYRQDWTVVDVPAGTAVATFKVGTILTFKEDAVQAFSDPKTGLGSPDAYTGVMDDGKSVTVQAQFGSKNMKYVLNGDGSGTSEDLKSATTKQAIKAATPPISNTTPPGGGGSDITGLVVFLAVIVGFVAFINEKKL